MKSKSNVIKELSTAELKEKLAVDRMQLNKMKINHAVTPLENPNQIKSMRRNIARMLTELASRDRQSSESKN
ncbi:MAG: 50S ribosomal protein L29 [Bacteroidales bacterium]|jgi:large subunit ribosomal protein L29|nr:50S ribosomal protein L29 [Bacteroidales bacterium]